MQEISILLMLIDQAFDHKAWHGTNLKGSVKGIDVNAAAWRPRPDRHNIWEIVIHTAYWKYIVRRRLLGLKRGSFPIKGSDWFVRPENQALSEKHWKNDVRLLTEMHLSMRESIASLDSQGLHLTPRGSQVSNLAMITGIASHDLYHAGQIQLIKKLGAKRAKRHTRRKSM